LVQARSFRVRVVPEELGGACTVSPLTGGEVWFELPAGFSWAKAAHGISSSAANNKGRTIVTFSF
jgi:hypothetical protein